MTAKEHNKLLGIFLLVAWRACKHSACILVAVIYGIIGGDVFAANARRADEQMMGGVFMALWLSSSCFLVVLILPQINLVGRINAKGTSRSANLGNCRQYSLLSVVSARNRRSAFTVYGFCSATKAKQFYLGEIMTYAAAVLSAAAAE